MPVILAQGARSYSAKVAPQYCDQTYSSSKKMYYSWGKTSCHGL